MPDVLHLRGPILAGPDDVRAQAWVADGRITYAPPPGRHPSLGRQYFRRTAMAPMEQIEATMSTSQGPW